MPLGVPMVASYDGDQMVSATADVYFDAASGDAVAAAHELGEQVAEQLFSQGARELIRDAEVAAMRDQLTSN